MTNSVSAAGGERGASCSKKEWPLITPPSKSGVRSISLSFGRTPRTIWVSRWQNWVRVAKEKKRTNCSKTPWPLSALPSGSDPKLICLSGPPPQNNLGNALVELGIRSGAEESRRLFEDALAADRSALEVYTKADLPQDWAMTQTNLGAALREFGKRTAGRRQSRKLIQDSVAAFRSSLEVYTRADLPQSWADGQNKFGRPQSENSENGAVGEEGRRLLQDALTAFRSALEVFTKADLPQDWAEWRE